MEIADHPRWQDGPRPFRIAICRALIVLLAATWGEGEKSGETFARLPEVPGREVDREFAGYADHATGAGGSGIQ